MFNGDDPSSKSTTPFCPDRGLMNQLQLCLTCLMGVHGHLRQFPERYKDCPSSSSWSFLIPPYHIISSSSINHTHTTSLQYKSTSLQHPISTFKAKVLPSHPGYHLSTYQSSHSPSAFRLKKHKRCLESFNILQHCSININTKCQAFPEVPFPPQHLNHNHNLNHHYRHWRERRCRLLKRTTLLTLLEESSLSRLPEQTTTFVFLSAMQTFSIH